MIYLKVVMKMSFDGIFLHKLLPELEILKTGRISKIIESGDTDFIFTIRVKSQNYNLMISLSSEFSRIHLTQKIYTAPSTPKSLTMFLRKHIEGYFIEDIKQYETDRILYFKLAGYNEMKDYTHKYLICEIMGRYSNLILTNEDFKILEVLKRDGVSEYSRTMLPNAIYEFPKNNKLNPYTSLNSLYISSPKDLCNHFCGISMLLSSYAFQSENWEETLKQALDFSLKPSIIKTNQEKADFYFHPLNNEVLKEFNSLSLLLDEFYYEEDLRAKIKYKTNDLANFIEKQIKKNEKKIIKLTADLLLAQNAGEDKIKGELLLSYSNLKAKEDQVTVLNYYTNELESIPLDPKIDIVANSQKYFKKYQKSKTAIHYINEQILLSENEIEYFKMLSTQLQHCSLNDAIEIQQELINQKYIAPKHTKPFSKKQMPSFLTYIVDDVLIRVGKNNLQNEYITHKLAKANEYWFHVQNASGSHVVVQATILNETLIRTAAMLAAHYSSLMQSSSVAVDYTQVKYIKKIPGKRNCFVTYTHQKTIYIDPDIRFIENLRIKK